MADDDSRLGRRAFLKRAAGLALGTISARGVYGMLDTIHPIGPAHAAAGAPTRGREQYAVENVELHSDNGVPVIIPPLYHEIVTAKITVANNAGALFRAQRRLEQGLQTVESPYAPTAAGLTIVVGWGLPYFRSYLPTALVDAAMPIDEQYSIASGSRKYALLDAIRFPIDRDEMLLEQNDLVFLMRSDDQSIIAAAEIVLFEDQSSAAYVGDLFSLTSVRKGFVGRGFGTRSVAKQLAQAAGVLGADSIPDDAQLMMGFTSTQQGALAPGKLVNFEAMPGVTNQWPAGYFTGGTAAHISHLFEDLSFWYGSFTPAARTSRMFSPRTVAAPGTVTIPNGADKVSSMQQVLSDAGAGTLGHNATLQQANRLSTAATDNYGTLYATGTPISLRDDFNTLDNPFYWTSKVDLDQWSERPAPGLHFVIFTATSQQFHRMKLAMDGVLPDGTNLRQPPHSIPDSANGINQAIRATHRQNYMIPPRARRSFPLVELLPAVQRQFLPLVTLSR
ncbi:MAG: hypothetical protein ABIV47_07640 [Roseiflexaceae bacterium]